MSKNTILLIEDNPLLTEAYKATLETKEFAVHATHNGTEGIEMIRKLKPSIVLLDIRIHGQGGLEVLEQIKKDAEISNIPVIIFTMSNDENDQKRAEELQADGYYLKNNTSLDDLVGYVEEKINV